jgi:8-oxo-dGTP diphosphatase
MTASINDSRLNMVGYNLVVILSEDKSKVLLCRRIKDPYLGKSNFIGGHIEPGESGEDAAYRELFEETSITRELVTLKHMMDFTYYNQGCYVEVWCGRLKTRIEVCGDENPLYWEDASTDLFDLNKYAGEGNMGHIMEQLKQFGEGLN